MNEEVIELHREHTGVLSMENEINVRNSRELALAYTPGVAELSKLIERNPELAREYTISGKCIAVITDGTAVLGLGNVGPQAGLPIVEGKALLYKSLAGVDAFPIAIKQGSVDEAVNTIKNLELTFAGIHLEDIQAPTCFEIEERLQKELSIPVYHDDQEGTAIVVLAGLINAAKLINRPLSELKVLITGIGASGIATANLLYAAGITQLTLVDIDGVLSKHKNCSNPYQEALVEKIDYKVEAETLAEAIVGQHVFIGLSDANIVTKEMVASMAENPIIFALANPVPEIHPDVAKTGGASIIGTGSSNFPNQINNILAFPGLFKGLLEMKVNAVTLDLQIKVAEAIAGLVPEPTPEKFVPGIFDEGVVEEVTQSVRNYKIKEEALV
ncbi:NADP-dependent malic enzyme [Carnobacterium divergens]|uniref:NADP-dependent malic enzyme n=1 Tax=Carnobacterium divergens TaxID=2748 RepID=A0AAW8RCL9_CARDV|nr:NADP-dependent malic enzyme [Carnobacterium divergens]MDT1959313.1 NADP-dependent malic enzyme [Carnobacterium divergens]MDT1975237.1 NADP-dependent malic enzyme [Carnobacterium divergens]